MHIYHLKNIFKNISVNRKIYLILVIELCLCYSLIYLGINETLSHGRREELISNDRDANIHTISYREKESSSPLSQLPHSTSLSSEELKKFLTNYGPLVAHSPVLNSEELKKLETNPDIEDFYYAEVSHMDHFTNSGDIRSIFVVISNKNFFEHYLKTNDATSSCCYMEPGLISELGSSYTYFSDNSLSVDGKKFDCRQIPEDLPPIVLSYDYQFDINPKSAVFFLKDDANENLSSEREILRVCIKYKTSEKNLDFETQEKLLEELNGFAGGEFLFSELYIAENFEEGSDDLNAFVRVFGWAGNVAFIIVIVGINGIFILIIQKRYKQICISYINGLTKKLAFMQIFLEVLFIVAVPSIIGMLLVLFIQQRVSTVYYAIETHLLTVIIFIVLPFVSAFIVTLMSSAWLRNLDVVKWLKRIE